MPGLGLSLPDVAGRIRGSAAAPAASITTIVIVGDSITATTPNQAANRGDFYSYAWADANSGKTVSVNAQASRTIGGAAMNGDGIDGPGGNGNTNSLLENRADDIAFGSQLLTVMIGANDLGTYQTATYIQRLIDWAGPIRAAGIKVAYSPPTPYRVTAPQSRQYADYTSRRNTLLATVRDPAVWGQWADYYIPIGEHPDFLDAANDAALYGDEVHPSAPVAAGTTGQARLHAIYTAAMTTLLDAGRTNAAGPYEAVWPVSETRLAMSTGIVRRFIVAGIAHAGLASGVGVAGGGAQVRLNGGSYGANTGRIYNGDVVDLKITTSASASTAVLTDLSIGGETRTLSYTTGPMVTPASYTHGDVINATVQGASYTFANVVFDATGMAVLAFNSGNAPGTVSVGGLPATIRRMRSADTALTIYTVPITATGARTVALTFAGYVAQVSMSYGVVEHADATPTQVDPGADGVQGADSQPFPTGSLTVPANGIALAFFAEYGGASITPATTNAGTTLVDEGHATFQSETAGIAVGSRVTSGAASFNFAFGPRPRIGIVFKAAGT